MLTEKYNSFLKSFFVRSEALTKELVNISNLLTTIKETVHHGTVVREVKPKALQLREPINFSDVAQYRFIFDGLAESSPGVMVSLDKAHWTITSTSLGTDLNYCLQELQIRPLIMHGFSFVVPLYIFRLLLLFSFFFIIVPLGLLLLIRFFVNRPATSELPFCLCVKTI